MTLNSKIPRAGKTFHPVALFGLVALLSHLLGWVQTPGELGMEKGPSLYSLLTEPPAPSCWVGHPGWRVCWEGCTGACVEEGRPGSPRLQGPGANLAPFLPVWGESRWAQCGLG